MKLYEFEGKELFKSVGIPVPEGKAIEKAADFDESLAKLNGFVVKAQVLSGKRGKNNAIAICGNKGEAIEAVKKLIGTDFKDEKIAKVLVEKKLQIKQEHYLAITYDTTYRQPVAVVSYEGGIDIEEYKEKNPGKVVIKPIDVFEGMQPFKAREILIEAGFNGAEILRVSNILLKLYECFVKYDCRLAEINPLIQTPGGEFLPSEFFAADAKVVLDDDAIFRHPEFKFPPRSTGKPPTQREIEAKLIDKDDHRGTAGSTYVDLDGDIGIIAAGGGASLTCMDALIAFGAKPANYTEHSGNPPAEKVEKLTKIVLSKPGLNGCWVVGGTANFTDIYETLKGFLNGIRATQPKPDYPIVIRRAGPRDREAFEMLRKAAKEEGWDLHLYDETTPMTATAKVVAELAENYRKKKGKK